MADSGRGDHIYHLANKREINLILALIIGGGVVLFIYAMSQSANADTPSSQSSPVRMFGPSGTIAMTAPDRAAILRAMALGIAAGEGYNRTGTIPQVRNNPGDIKVGGVIGWFLPDSVDAPVSGGGWNQLLHNLQVIMNGSSVNYSLNMTLGDFANTWTADGYGTPELASWTDAVVSSLNNAGYAVDATTTLLALGRGDFSNADNPQPAAPLPDLLPADVGGITLSDAITQVSTSGLE